MKEFSTVDIAPTLILTVYSDEEMTQIKDISASSAQAYVIKRPDETVVKRTVTFLSTGVDGKLTYTLIAADLVDLEGLHDVQIYLDGTPWKGQSSSYQFLVRETHIAP